MMHYQLLANGNPVTVYQWPCRAYDIKTYAGEIYKHIADQMAFAILTGEGAVEFTVIPDAPFENVKIRPLSAGIDFTVTDGKIVFTVAKPVTLSIELDGDVLSPLFVYYSPKTPIPENCDYYYGPGEHDVGLVQLTSGQTAYIEEGAIVHGAFHAEDAENIPVIGEGIISGVKMHREEVTMDKMMLLDFIRCKNVKIGAMTLYDGPVWLCRTLDCDYIDINGLREISMNPSGDGIDICNSRHAHIQNCFMRTNDDCITLKAGHPDLTSGHSAYRLGEAWGQNIDNGLPNEGHPVPGGARVYSRTDEIYSNTQHIIEIIAAKAPTCTEPGLTEGRQCTECGEVLVTQEEIPALGHDLQAAKTGKKLAKECSRCTYAEIIAAAAVTGKTVTVTLDGDIKPRFVWAASYDGQNRFVELVMKEVTGKTVTLTFGKDARGAVKVFFLDGSKTPCLEALAPK